MKKRLQKPACQDVLHNERLVPEPRPSKRKLGTLKGCIRVEPDFDELPPDILDAMEGN